MNIALRPSQGHDIHSLVSISVPRKSQVIELCHHIALDAADNRLWTARSASLR